ncbi:MAG: MFS transporter [Armatimonadota bacterium]|nr:MFS transporter [Armatimonadota bacterium]MDR7533677.1 MFS transporter [Armatimonadota bacterium]MDR7535488.1 MFS transporter [Armatimonadota bacterium]
MADSELAPAAASAPGDVAAAASAPGDVAVAAPAVPGRRRDPRAAFALLRLRNYRLLWSGLLISHVGSWMQFTALGYLIDDLTRAPVYLGLLGLVQAVPRLLFAFLGGVAADRLDRRMVLLVTNAALMASATLLGVLAVTGRIQVWHVLVIGAFNSFANSFDMPARQSMVPSLVGERHLMAAVSLNSMAFNGSGIIGPSIGGVVIATVGVAGCFFANALTYIAVLAALLRMQVPPRQSQARESVGQDIREGLALLVRHRHVLAVLGLVAVVSFFGRPYIRLMPAMAREVLGVGPQGLGVLQAAPGIGTVLAVFAIGALGDAPRGRLLLRAGAAMGTLVVLVALSRWFLLSVALLVTVGTAQAVALAAANTVLQTTVRPEQRGRIMGLYGMVTFGMFALGTLPLGALAGAIGVGAALALGGAVVVAVAGLVALGAPQVARL